MTYHARGRPLWELLLASFCICFLIGFVGVLCIGNFFRARKAQERQKQRRLQRLSYGNGQQASPASSHPSSATSGAASSTHSGHGGRGAGMAGIAGTGIGQDEPLLTLHHPSETVPVRQRNAPSSYSDAPNYNSNNNNLLFGSPQISEPRRPPQVMRV